MSLGEKVRRALSMSPPQLARKIARKARREIDRFYARRHDQNRSTFGPRNSSDSGFIQTRMGPAPIDLIRLIEDDIFDLTGRWMQGRFDLLGSGWTSLHVGAAAKGLGGYRYGASPPARRLIETINRANRDEARRIAALINPNYEPIDWHVDFKSGARWPADAWFEDIRIGLQPGVDVKVPWELARMQHLPVLAWAHSLLRARPRAGMSAAAVAQFARDQILDFISCNPPRFGVNWHCAMDVAIRAANWILAVDLFSADGAPFDAPFQAELTRSLRAHARHLAHHRSWNEDLRGNHYLSEIMGLLVIAGSLPTDAETTAWRRLASKELLREIELQFHPDGSNFEASTSYHRLSGELAVFGLAFLLGCDFFDARSLPEAVLERIHNIGAFARDTAGPDGLDIQFGDNDSGRLFRLRPFRGVPTETNDRPELNRRHDALVGAVNALVAAGVDMSDACNLDGHVVRQWARGKKLPGSKQRPALKLSGSPSGWNCRVYSDFGLAVYRFENAYLALRCGRVGQNGFGGHAHNDALSFVLSIGGRSVMIDPGTYVYTPLSEMRNRFRSTLSHNTLALEGREQNPFTEGALFRLFERANARIVHAADDEFVGVHTGFGPEHRRRMKLAPGLIEVCDECAAPGQKTLSFHLDPAVIVMSRPDGGVMTLAAGDHQFKLTSRTGRWTVEPGWRSPEYGEIEPTQVLRLRSQEHVVHWSISWSGGP